MTRRELLYALLAGPAAVVQGQVGPPADEITALRVRELVQRVATGALAPPAVVEAYLARIAQVEPTLRAFITVSAERARAEARRPSKGPLRGVPVAHKDIFETAGVRTTAGSRIFERYVPIADADLVRQLADAGALLIGKTNLHELGGGVTTINPFFGTTTNPVDASRIAGGSSGGSAAAVVARLAPAATGSDTGGSVRIPAALSGCVGFKPTFGLLGTGGLLGACPTFDHAGLFARSVDDVSIVFAAATGRTIAPGPAAPALRAPFGRPGSVPLRVGIARGFFFDGIDPDVAAGVDRALERLRAVGATLLDRDLPVDDQTMARVFDPIVTWEIWQRYGNEWRTRPQLFSPGFAEFFQTPPPSATELAAARRALALFQKDVAAAFANLDVIVTPTVPVTAPLVGGPIDAARILRNTWPFNAARTPAISIPCDREGTAGLPVGLQIAGRTGTDDLVLAVAALAEAHAA